MPESMPYPGSPSLSPDAREKVLQTFRHTLNLAQSGRNEEALLGCDFILKMDPRFAPARRLLDALRGIAPGTVVDLSGFSDFGLSAESAPAAAPSVAPVPAAPPAAHAPVAPAPAAAAPAPRPAAPAPVMAPSAPQAPIAPAKLDDLSLDDFGGEPAPTPGRAATAGPSPSAPAPAFAFAPPAPPPPPSFSAGEPEPTPGEFMAPTEIYLPAPDLDSLGFGVVPDLPPLGGPGLVADAPAEAPEADFGAPGAFDMPEMGPAPAAPPTPTSSHAAPQAPSRTGPDPRIVQFLRQGDDAMARGNVQEAIDLWSRVFLIDLSNEEASQRIDRARDAQAENARKVDSLVSEGIQLYDLGDLTGARHKFLDVLAIAEGEATARSYLNQIDASLATAAAGAEPSSPALSDYGADDLASAGASSYASDTPLSDIVRPAPEPEEEAGQEEARVAPAKRTIDVRVLLLAAAVVLVAIGVGTWFLLKKRTPRAVAPAPAPVAGPQTGTATPGPGGTAAQHAVDQAQVLFDQGKVEEAQALARSVPATDPRYPDALAFIAKMQSSAPPQPTPGGQTAASLDELRVTGLAAAKASRYIDAVKALDRVAKAHPEDTEVAQELSRSREQVAAMASAVKSFNESDYESAIKLLWTLRKADLKNQDVEEYLFKSYFNQGVQNLQAGNAPAAATAFQESLNLHPTDTEAQRHLKFSRKYVKGTTELVAQIYVRHLAPRS